MAGSKIRCLLALALALPHPGCRDETPTVSGEPRAATTASPEGIPTATASGARAEGPGVSPTASESAAQGSLGGDDRPPPSTPTRAAVSAAPSSPKPVIEPEPEPVEGSKKSGAEYAAWLQGPKKIKVGQSAALSAVFTASGKYHCNEKYPTSFKPDAAPAGVSFASDKFTGASFSEKRSSVPVQLSASSPGTKTVTGTLKFGVCDEKECIPVKAPVSFSFEVE